MEYFMKNGPCGTETAFNAMGSRWKPRIIDVCVNEDNVTYQRLRSALTGISDSTLARQIRSLMDDDMIMKVDDKYYRVTDKCRDILPSMAMLQEFAHNCGYIEANLSSSVEYSKKIIGTKWKSRIIWLLHSLGSVRFNTIQNSIEGLSHKVLKEQLDDFLEYGIIERIDYKTKEPHVEYRLTGRGENAYKIVQSLADWCIRQDLIHPKITISY